MLDYKTILIRIKSTNNFKLIKIILFKMVYNLLLFIDYLRYKKNRCFISPILLGGSTNDLLDSLITLRTNIWGEKENFTEYIKKYSNKHLQNIINSADNICRGKINLWGKEYQIEKYNWHYDLLSGENWPDNLFFNHIKEEYNNLGDIKYVLEINKLNQVVILGQAYYLTGNCDYYNEIKKIITSWIYQNPVNIGVNWKIKLDLGLRNINLFFAILLFLDNQQFVYETLPFILGIISENNKQITKYASSKWFKSHQGSNHNIGEIVGLLIPLLTIPSFNNEYLIKKYSKYLKMALDSTITEDGVYLEQSTNYSKFVAELLLVLDLLYKGCKQNFILKIDFSKHLSNLICYLDSIQFNKFLPNIGDCDGAKAIVFSCCKPFWDISHILAYGKFVMYCDLKQPNIDNIDSYLIWILGVDRLKNVNKRNKQSEGKNDKKYSLFCSKWGGQFAFKELKYNSVYIYLRAGRHSYIEAGANVHSHNDLLSVILSVNNIPLFVDKGTFLYNSGIEQRNLDRSTGSHNTVFINQLEQVEMLSKWSYKDCPVSDITLFSFYENELVFKGVCKYADVEHQRELSFDVVEKTLQIKDTVIAPLERMIKVNFLLHHLVDVKKVSDNEILLFSKNKKVASFKQDGCYDLQIIESEYYPLFTNRISTYQLSTLYKMKDKKEIITTINFI